MASNELLGPRLVVAGGFAATGKTTTMEYLTRMIPNGFLVSYGRVSNSILHIPTASKPRLPDLQDCVARDAVPYDEQHLVQTPVGEMLVVPPSNDFFGRHALYQSRLAIAQIAGQNLRLGKVALIDCAPIPDYLRGTLGMFFEMESLKDYPQYLLHFVASEEDAYRRGLARLRRGDSNSIARDQERLSSPEAFHDFVTKVQPMYPPQLSQFRYLLVNTSEATPEECAEMCLNYISKDQGPVLSQVTPHLL